MRFTQNPIALSAAWIVALTLILGCTAHESPPRGQIPEDPHWVALPASSLLATIHESQNGATIVGRITYKEPRQLLDYLSKRLDEHKENNILFIASNKAAIGPKDPLHLLTQFSAEHNLNLFVVPATGKDIPAGKALQLVIASESKGP